MWSKTQLPLPCVLSCFPSTLAAEEKATSAEFEYKISYVSNDDGVLCLPNLRAHTHNFRNINLQCSFMSQMLKISFRQFEPHSKLWFTGIPAVTSPSFTEGTLVMRIS